MVEFAANGGKTSGYVTKPESGEGPGVIVLQEWWGLVGHIKNVADRFAAEGYVTISPDMYYRAGPNNVVGYDDIPKIMPLMQSMDDMQTNADIRVVIDFVKRGLPKAKADRIGCTGYCMGGTISWLAACLNRDIKAAAVYYPGGFLPRETSGRRPRSPHEYAELLTAPVLGCFGETDQNPAPADVNEVDAYLNKLGKDHDFKIYPGAGHGFFCDERPSFNKEAAEDAWARTLAFYGKHLKG